MSLPIEITQDTRSWHSAITDGERGSQWLFDELHRQYLDFALKHGVTLKDAELLLMNGVGL